MFMKGRILCIYKLFQKIKYFPNNILSVSRELILSKWNEHDFLKSNRFGLKDEMLLIRCPFNIESFTKILI